MTTSTGDREAMGRHWVISSIVAPVVVAVIIGMASAYLTATVTLAKYEERIDANTRDIGANRVDIVEAERRERASSERLIRLETKIDMVLDKIARDSRRE